MPRGSFVRRGSLPEQRTSFVGREVKLAAARKLLSRSRLLRLIGPGGTGRHAWQQSWHLELRATSRTA